MDIILGKTAGFCYGVKRAVEEAHKELEKSCGEKIYCLGELVHNKQVIEDLKYKGLEIIEDIENIEDNKTLIIRAHGISKQVYEQAKKKNIKIIDLTCPSVFNIHKKVEEYSKNNYIFLLGEKEHPETIGTKGFCGYNLSVIETDEDIKLSIEKLKESSIKNLYIVAQTTFSLQKFNDFVEIINTELKKENINITINNSICNTTKLRQEETLKISKQVDCMIIIGGKNSANTKKLYEIAHNECKSIYHIENAEELDVEKIKSNNKVGVMAGASTPYKCIEEVLNILKG